ncbi:MAG: acyl-CoA dehydrogenase family protein [Gemmatimonadota bacterium]
MPHEAVATAISLAPAIHEVRTETEAQRRLPESIVAALVESNLFRLALPSDLGGLELDPVVALQVYEELAKAEAAAAWVVWNSALPCLFGRFLSGTARQEVFGNTSGKYASSTRPTGGAVTENGHYRLSGRWSLVSGCMHADWIGLMHMVMKDGEVEMLAPGAPNMRMAFVPKAACEIVDTWHVGGLRGTGSHDVVVDDMVVSAEMTFSPMEPSHLDRPIGRVPIACTMSAGLAAICLGIAQAAVDAVVSLGLTKVTVDAVPDLRDRSPNQILVATAGARIDAFRRVLHGTLGNLWRLAESGAEWTAEDIADVWAASTTTARECRSLVTDMYEVAGSSALYTDCTLERCHRDIHAALQHIVVQPVWLEEAGRVKLGLEPTNPLFGL